MGYGPDAHRTIFGWAAPSLIFFGVYLLEDEVRDSVNPD